MMTEDTRHIYESLIPGLKWTDKKEISANCPLHDDSHPSMSINNETGKWFCHVCNTGGSAETLNKKIKGIEPGMNTISGKKNIDTIYEYTDESGRRLYQVVRYKEPKTFLQRRPDGNGGWIWNTDGVRSVPYNLPDVVKADLIFDVEGEKDVEALRKMGLTGTTNSGGAGNWKPEYNEYFRGKDVVILPDNDEPGRKHAQDVARNLYGIAKSIKIVELQGLPEKGDTSDWVKIPGNDRARLLSIVEAVELWKPDRETTTENIEEPWPDPIPFDNLSLLPDFPIAALPPIGQEIASLVAEVMQTDTSLPATIYLSVLSAAVVKKGKVDLNTHAEPLNLFTCNILPSGERKTASMGIMTTPLYDFQKRTQVEMSNEVKLKIAVHDTNAERLKHLQKSAARENNSIERDLLEQEIVELASTLDDPPELPVCIVDDITPEMLGNLMANNQERMSVFSTEGGIFQIMAGRYEDKRGGNIDLFLKGHSGDPWSCHRIGRESQTMMQPSITMCLTVQPDVINEIGKNKSFRGRGLHARFLFNVGQPHAGYRHRQVKVIPDDMLQTYNHHIIELLNLPLSERHITLTPEAHEVWNEFYNDIEKEMRPGGDLYYLKDWGSKLPGQVARIAGLLHFATHGEKAINEPISVNSVNNSCVIGSFFIEHALAAFGLMQANPGIEAAKTILSYITREKADSFKGRDVIRHTGLRTMEDVTPGLNILIERGYIREIGKIKFGIGRPESVAYIVNPKIFM